MFLVEEDDVDRLYRFKRFPIESELSKGEKPGYSGTPAFQLRRILFFIPISIFIFFWNYSIGNS